MQSTLLKALNNGNFVSFPGLTEKLIINHLHATVATAQGHLQQERQNIQSTKSANYNITLQDIKTKFQKLKKELPQGMSFKSAVESEILSDFFPESSKPNVKSKKNLHAIVDLKELVT